MTCSVLDVRRLQDELQQRPPFATPAQEAVVALMRTTDVVRRQLARVVEPHGITLQQYNVLRILRGGGPDGVPTLDVAARMIEETPGITRLLDRLDAKRLVKRERCPHDRRQHLCWITADGQALLQTLDGPLLAAAEACMKGLSARDRLGLVRLLEAVRAG
jgi:MarR family transcriptional regulator, organic hydroperoxide resistance regulator